MAAQPSESGSVSRQAFQRARGTMTKTDLARTIGVSVGTVSRWEDGTSVPQPSHRRSLAHAFGLDESEIGAMFGLTSARSNVVQHPTATREASPSVTSATEEGVVAQSDQLDRVTAVLLAHLEGTRTLSRRELGASLDLFDYLRG